MFLLVPGMVVGGNNVAVQRAQMDLPLVRLFHQAAEDPNDFFSLATDSKYKLGGADFFEFILAQERQTFRVQTLQSTHERNGAEVGETFRRFRFPKKS